MKAVVVWEQVPEETTTYEVEVSDEQAAKLRAAHGAYLNLANNSEEAESAVEWISEMLDSEWAENEVKGPIESKPDLIVLCGFIL